jgi:hypothetical protein
MSTKSDYQVGDRLFVRMDADGGVLDDRYKTLVELYVEEHAETRGSSCVSLRMTEYLGREQVVELRDLLTQAIEGRHPKP